MSKLGVHVALLGNSAVCFLILAIVLMFQLPLAGSQITVAWNGGTGDWVDPTQWSPSVAPNNGSDTYLVTINSGMPDNVSLLFGNAFIDGITVGPQATVSFNDTGLILGNPASASPLLSNTGAMNFTNAGSLTLDFSGGGSASNSSAITIGDESAIFMNTVTGGTGTLTNTGNINLQSNPHGSQIYLSGDGATFTLNGGGAVTLSDNASNLISGSFGTESLVSNNKLSGAGTVTNLLSFTNNGTVTANGANPLTFNMDYSILTGFHSTGSITNNGSISVTNGSTLNLAGANGDFSLVDNGTISLNGQGASTQLIYNNGNTNHALFLSGTGTLSLSDSSANLISGVTGETLYNQAGHTITGAGTIELFGGGIFNNGTIIANGSNLLNIEVTDSAVRGLPGLTNNGLIQVNDGSSLQILSAVGTKIVNAGSITLNANASTSTLIFSDLENAGTSVPGSVFELSGGGSLTLSDNPGNRIKGATSDEGFQIDAGATLSGAGTIINLGGYEALTNLGTIIANGRNPLILDGAAALTASGAFAALSNFGLLQINDGSTFGIVSAVGALIHNWSGFAPANGLITLNALTSTSTLSFNSLGQPATFYFQGGNGTLSMSDNPGNRIVGVSGAETLFNDNHTIQGAGTISNFNQIQNQGTIIANGVNPLILAISELTAGGLSNSGLIRINDGSTLEVLHTGANILNTGSITLNAALGTSTLAINDQGTNQPLLAIGTGDPLYLYGSGLVIMSDNPGNRIVGVSGDETLLNASGIEGAGTISNFGGGFANLGGVLANGVNPLIIDTTAATNLGFLPGVTNNGVMQANDGSTLQIRSGVGGTVVNNGTINLISSLGTSTLGFNDLGMSQTFNLTGNGTVNIESGSGNRIIGVNGDETLINGVGSTIIGHGIISNLAQFTNNGSLLAYSPGGPGTLEVKAPLGNWNSATGTLTGGSYTAENGSSLLLDSLGTKTITNLVGVTIDTLDTSLVANAAGVNVLTGLANMTNSTVSASTGPLTITPNGASSLTLTDSSLSLYGGSPISLTGSYSQDASSRFALGGFGVVSRTTLAVSGGFNNQGIVTIGTSASPATLNIAGTFTNSGSFYVFPGSNSVSSSDFTNSGLLNVDNGGSAVFTGSASNSGTVEVFSGGQLSVDRALFRAANTNVYVQTAGMTKVLTGGTLNAAAFDLEGGTLGGGGTINASVDVSGGIIEPGDPTITNIDGDFTLDPGGEIFLEIDGPGAGQFDGLDITGNLHLDGGTLEILFGNGYVPQPGDSWNLLTFTGTEDGAGFGNITFDNGGNEQFIEFLSGQNFELETQQGAATPEPETFLLVLVALIAGIPLWRARSRTRTNPVMSHPFHNQ